MSSHATDLVVYVKSSSLLLLDKLGLTKLSVALTTCDCKVYSYAPTLPTMLADVFCVRRQRFFVSQRVGLICR